jgi:CRP-like cAMP-binding protein
MLFLSGEPMSGLFVVVSGKIRAFQQNEDGREQVMHVDAAGSVLGASKPYGTTPTYSNYWAFDMRRPCFNFFMALRIR